MDQELEQQPRPPLATYEELAGRIDHMLVRPDLSSDQVFAGLQLARRYSVASAIVRPCDIDLAIRTLQGSPVRPGSVAGFPHGDQNTAVKLYEVRDLIRRGAKEIEMVIAIPKLLSREFQYVQTELDQAAESCQQAGVIFKVILEAGFLTRELKIIATVCCERAGVDLMVTSTGFGPAGYTAEDFNIMREHLPEESGVKAVGGIETVDQTLAAYEQGFDRFGTTATAVILDAWKSRVAAAQAASQPPAGIPQTNP